MPTSPRGLLPKLHLSSHGGDSAGSAAEDFAKWLQRKDHRGQDTSRRPDTHRGYETSRKRISFEPELSAVRPTLAAMDGDSHEALTEALDQSPLFVDEKEWSNVMNNTLALLMFVFVLGVIYCCYTLIAPYRDGIGWGILLSIVFHKSGESLFAHGRARKSRREECLAAVMRRRKEVKQTLARIFSSKGFTPKTSSHKSNDSDDTERAQGLGIIMSFLSNLCISLVARVVSVWVFMEYMLLEVADQLGLKKIHFIPDSEKQYTLTHRIFLCGMTYAVLGGTGLAVGGPIAFLIIHLLIAIVLAGFLLPYVSVDGFMPIALRLVKIVVVGSISLLLAFSFYRDVGNVTEIVSSGASSLLGDNGHMVGEFFSNIEGSLLEDVARSFNASNVTKTAHDIRHALKPLVVQWSGSEDGEVRVLNWTEQINLILSSFYSTTETLEDAHLSNRQKKRRARKARQQSALGDLANGGTGHDSLSIQAPPLLNQPTEVVLGIGDDTEEEVVTPPKSPSIRNSPGVFSTAQTLLSALGSKLRPAMGVVMPLFATLFSNIMRLFDSIYEFVLFTCVFRFLQMQQDSVLYYTIRKAFSTVDPWTAPARARALEEDIILQFLTLLQSFWHISWYHFSVTYVCLELCGIPLPFLLGITSVLMALFPLLTRFVSPVFVAFYVLFINGVMLTGDMAFLTTTACTMLAVMCMVLQSWHRYGLMFVLYVVGRTSISSFDLFRWMVLLLGIAALQNDEWLLTVRRSTHTRGTRKTGNSNNNNNNCAANPASPSLLGKRATGAAESSDNSNSNSCDSAFDSANQRALSLTTEGGELPTFIVGTCVVLGLVTYGLPGVIVGPLLFIVAKATYDNIGWDIPADIIAATDAALRGGDPSALYEAVGMYTGLSHQQATSATGAPPAAGGEGEAPTASVAPRGDSRQSPSLLMQSHTGSSTLLRTAVWRALASQRRGAARGSSSSPNLSGADLFRSPLPQDPRNRRRPHSPLDLDRSETSTPVTNGPASRSSSSSDIGTHMSQTGLQSVTSKKR